MNIEDDDNLDVDINLEKALEEFYSYFQNLEDELDGIRTNRNESLKDRVWASIMQVDIQTTKKYILNLSEECLGKEFCSRKVSSVEDLMKL